MPESPDENWPMACRSFVLVIMRSSLLLTIGALGCAKYERVELGPIVEGLRVVRSGLQGDETIIVEGIGKVRPDSKVLAKETDMSNYASEQLAMQTHVNAGSAENAGSSGGAAGVSDNRAKSENGRNQARGTERGNAESLGRQR